MIITKALHHLTLIREVHQKENENKAKQIIIPRGSLRFASQEGDKTDKKKFLTCSRKQSPS